MPLLSLRQAENTLFRIHSHIVELSAIFSGLFPVDHCLCRICERAYPHRALPPPVNHFYKTVKAAEFEALLDIIYAP
jgi:hypothetical protein